MVLNFPALDSLGLSQILNVSATGSLSIPADSKGTVPTAAEYNDNGYRGLSTNAFRSQSDKLHKYKILTLNI